MRKYKNLYQHEGKWYTKDNRKAKTGDKVLIVNKSPYSNKDFKNGDILKIINATGQWTDGTRYGNKIGQFLEQSEYRVLVPHINGMEITDTWYEEMTQMDQPKYEVLYGGIGSKKQPVPFSKEYYGRGNGKSMKTAKNTADSISIDVNAPEKMTQEEYDKIESNLWRTVNELDARTSGLYRSIYVNYAERILAELKKRIVPEKRKWTEAEIEEARRTVLSYNLDTKYILTSNPMIVGAYYFNTKTNKFNCAAATYMKNDTFDYWIGRMVACLKVHDKQLPEWIKGG